MWTNCLAFNHPGTSLARSAVALARLFEDLVDRWAPALVLDTDPAPGPGPVASAAGVSAAAPAAAAAAAVRASGREGLAAAIAASLASHGSEETLPVQDPTVTTSNDHHA